LSQHNMILIDMKLKGVMKAEREKSQLKMRVWMLEDEKVQRNSKRYKCWGRMKSVVMMNEIWERMKEGLLKAASEVYGWTKGQ